MVTTISPSVFLSKRESRLRDERASKDPEDTSFAHAVSGNSLHNFVLENLLSTAKLEVSVELPDAAWLMKRCRDPSTRTPFASSGSCSLRMTEGCGIQLRHHLLEDRNGRLLRLQPGLGHDLRTQFAQQTIELIDQLLWLG